MRALAALPLLLLATHARSARADDVRATIGGNGWYDAALVTTASAGILVGSFGLPARKGDRAPLDGAGHRPARPGWALASDVTLVLGLAAGSTAAGLVDRSAPGDRDSTRLRGPIVTLEGALVGSMLAQLTKNLFGVCRPRDWDDGTRTCAATDDARRSFPSGHTAPLAGMAGAALGIALLSGERRAGEVGVAVGTTSLALLMAVLRDRAGAHTLIDTGAALLFGGLAGFGVAALHLGPSHPREQGAASAPLVSFGGGF